VWFVGLDDGGVQGLFCSSYGANRGPGFSVCRRAWCGECYTLHPMDNFHVFAPKDKSGFEWRKSPGDRLRYKCARNGDHLVTPFQCHFCHFQILTLRNPIQGDPRDEMLLCCLTRANLDACWSRETSTIDANRRNLAQVIQIWKQMGIRPHVLPPLGPHNPQDLFGMAAAVAMLSKSTQPGKHDENYTQFESLWKLRAAYSNFYHASAYSTSTAMTLGRDTAKSFLTTCPTQSMWFERFTKGCLKRMGQEIKQDLAVSIHVMKALQALLEKEWQHSNNISHRLDLALLGAYALITFAGSFRGHEVFLVDTYGLLKYAAEERFERGEKFVMVPLLGKYQTEAHESYHLTPLAAKTSSGLEIESWVHRLAWAKHTQAISHGPAFSKTSGKLLDSRWVEMEILDRLSQIQQENPEIISPDVQVYEEYGIS
jgi:hypothetical protein